MVVNLWQIILIIFIIGLLFSDINIIINNIKKNIKKLKKLK
jgi:predicted tellurium resistance membrane protein TerC